MCICGQVRRFTNSYRANKLMLSVGIFNGQLMTAWRAAAKNFFVNKQMQYMIIKDSSFSMVFALDGSTVETTKPADHSLAMGSYSGYHGHHCAAVVCVSSVSGLVVASSRVFGGHDNDLTVYAGSVFSKVLNDATLRPRLLADPSDVNFIVAADGIFHEDAYVATTKQIHQNDDERERSKALSSFRVQIEHSFNDVKGYFKKLKFGTSLRWGQNLLEPIILLSILLSNCRICLEGTSLTASRFGARVPSLEEYLAENHDQHTDDLINGCL